MSAPTGRRPNYRGLWSAVVLQALDDIEKQPTQSMAFTDAVAFFTRSGVWAESRTMIADCLELHRDELEAIGRRFIDARRSGEEFGDTVRRSLHEQCVSQIKLARLVARRSASHRDALRMPVPRSKPAAAQPGLPTGNLPPNIHPNSGDHLRM